MSRMTPGVDPSLMAQITQLAQIGTQQRGQDMQRAEAGAQRQLQRERMAQASQESALDRQLAKEAELLSLAEAQTSRQFAAEQAEANRTFQAQQNEDDRNFRRELMEEQMAETKRLERIKADMELARLDVNQSDLAAQQAEIEAADDRVFKLQMDQAEAVALQTGKGEEFNKAKFELGRNLREKGQALLNFEDRQNVALGEVATGVGLDISKATGGVGVDAKDAIKGVPALRVNQYLIGRAIGDAASNIGSYLYNAFLAEEEGGVAVGDAKIRKERADELFESGSMRDRASVTRSVSNAVGESIAIALDQQEDAGAISDLVSLQLSGAEQGRDVREAVERTLEDLEIDPELYYSGVHNAFKKFASSARTIERSVGEEISSSEVQNYIFARAVRESGLAQAVASMPKTTSGQKYMGYATELGAVETPDIDTVRGIFEGSDVDITDLASAIESLDLGTEEIAELQRELLRAERAVGQTTRDVQSRIGEAERQREIEALKILRGGI